MKQKTGSTGARPILSIVTSVLLCLFGTGNVAANFGWVSGIAVDGEGDLFVGDPSHHRIVKFSPTVAFQSIVVKGRVVDPGALAADRHGVLYIAAPDMHAILKLGPAGAQTILSLGKDMEPKALAMDKNGNLYFATSSGRLLRYTFATRSFDDLGLGPIPSALAIDADGTLYVGSNSGPPLAVSADGSRTKVSCGDCTSQGVAVDAEGNLYVADADHHRVLMRKGTGEFVTAAGNGKAGLTGDGGEATQASLNFPTAIAIDPAGNVFIFDYLNNVVRKVTNGVITTLATPDVN